MPHSAIGQFEGLVGPEGPGDPSESGGLRRPHFLQAIASLIRPRPPTGGAYQNSSHSFLDWAPAPDEGRIKTQAISSLTGPRPPKGGAYQNSSHSFLNWAPAPDEGAYQSSNHNFLD